MKRLAHTLRQAATRWAANQPTPLVFRALEPWTPQTRDLS